MRKRSLVFIFTLLAVMMLPGMMVSAQRGLDSSLDSNYGVYTINPGFLPDPYIITILSGGDLDASRQNLGAQCAGNVTRQPDLVINWRADSQNMHLFFVGSNDTTLIVELPDGTILCNDDTVGLDPSVNIRSPKAGNYAIWVGTYGAANQYVPGYLMVSEFEQSLPGTIYTNIPNFVTSYVDFGGSSGSNTQTNTPTQPSLPNSAGDLNPDGSPSYGTSDLSDGFTPDPATVTMTSGGSVDVTAMNIGRECRGFTAENPDHRVEWSGAGDLLRLFFISEGDTTLIVRAPSGEFFCNDDFGSLNPLVDIENPEAGAYDVWVGTFGVDELLPGTLYISGSTSSDPLSVSG